MTELGETVVHVGQFKSTLRFRTSTVIVSLIELILSCLSIVRVFLIYLHIGNSPHAIHNKLVLIILLLFVAWLVLFWWYASLRLYYSTKRNRPIPIAILDLTLWRRCGILLLVIFAIIVLSKLSDEVRREDEYYWYEVSLIIRVIFLLLVYNYQKELQSALDSNISPAPIPQMTMPSYQNLAADQQQQQQPSAPVASAVNPDYPTK